MREKVELLNLAVDIASTEEAADATITYMGQEGSKVVYFLNSETLLLLQENSGWKIAVEECELVLPGTANVNKSVNDVLGHTRSSFFFESYLERIMDYAVDQGLDLLLVAENGEQLAFVQENIHQRWPYLALAGSYMSETEESLEHVVNEINSVAPDVLLLALPEKKQLELLEDYRSQMNAGLFLFTGHLLPHRAVVESEVPEKIQRLKIDNLYKWFHLDGRVKAFFNNIRMKIQIRKHHKGKDS